MLYSAIVSALITAAAFFYFSLSLIETLLLCLVVLTTIMVSKHVMGLGVLEGFSGDQEDTRYVHYGDTILVWTYKNTFMRTHQGKYIDDSSRLSNPDEVPRAWVWEYFTVEDSRDPRWRAGSRNAIKYGDKIYLRTWLPYNSGAGWVRPGVDQYIGASDREPQCALTIENADTASNSSSFVTYGDAIYLKTWRNMYINKPEQDGAKYTQVPADQRGPNSLFRVYDKYGQGVLVDWATRGFATQSSIYGSYDASNAIDGNPLTISHTNIEQNAWWQVELPRDIQIDSIVIMNRKDCCQSRMADFDVTILNSKGTSVYSKNFKDTRDIYTASGVNKTGRVVKVQLRGTNYLHISGLKVHGTPVQYSTIVDTPVVADLVSAETSIGSGDRLVFHSNAIPMVGRDNSISLSLCCKPESVDGPLMLLYKGEGFYITIGGGQVVVNMITSKGKDKVTSTSRITARSWNHIGVVLKAGVSSKTGWLYGEFSDPKPAGTPATCCYVVNPYKKEYYYIKSPGAFSDTQKNTWSASYVDNMKYMGELTSELTSLTIYINGQPDITRNLEGTVEITDDAIVLGQAQTPTSAAATASTPSASTPSASTPAPTPKESLDLPSAGFAGLINMMRFYNYAVQPRAIQRDSQFQYSASTLELSRGEVEANTEQVIGAHLLPSIGQEVSVSFWLYSSRPDKGTGKADPIFWKGDRTPESLPYVAFMPNSNNLNMSVTTVEEIRDIRPGKWYHVAQVIRGSEHMSYLNGKLVSTTTSPSATTAVSYASGSLHIGGFNGKFKDVKYHNFALSEDEVRDQMGQGPGHKTRSTAEQLWRTLGCTTDLPEDTSDEEQLQQYKGKADKGDIKSIELCYGKRASVLTEELNKSSKLLAHSVNGNQQMQKKCLPMAPFECRTVGVNDFDIRTHKDFHKYSAPGDLQTELTKTKKALAEMQELKRGKGDNIIRNISEQEEKLKSMPLGSPADIQHARQLAAINLIKDMDPKTLGQIPLFQEVLQEARAQGNNDVGPKALKAHGDLEAHEAHEALKALKALKEDLELKLRNTTRFTEDVFKTIPGLDASMIRNIIGSKEDLSKNKEYIDTILRIKSYSMRPDIASHPDYKDLLSRLNRLTADQVNSEGEMYQDFKAQAGRCAALFESGKVVMSDKALLKIFDSKVKTDPEFKALLKNIIYTESQRNSELQDILRKAEDEKYMNDPEFQNFLLAITKAELKANPLYKKMLSRLIGSRTDMRIEDHPEYNKYADDMKRSLCK